MGKTSKEEINLIELINKSTTSATLFVALQNILITFKYMDHILWDFIKNKTFDEIVINAENTYRDLIK